MTDLRSAPVPAPHPGDHTRGPSQSPLLIFYGEFACPRCALAHARLSRVPVRVVFRHFALRAGHSRALPAAHACEAAALQGRFWAMHDALMSDQGRLEDPHLWQRAQMLGLDVERFEVDRRSHAVSERVTGDVRSALRAGVTVTPTLFSDGVAHVGAPDERWLEDLTRREVPSSRSQDVR